MGIRDIRLNIRYFSQLLKILHFYLMRSVEMVSVLFNGENKNLFIYLLIYLFIYYSSNKYRDWHVSCNLSQKFVNDLFLDSSKPIKILAKFFNVWTL